MSKQKHIWLVVDKDGYTGHDFARNFYTDAFFARSDARYDAVTPCGKGRVVKYVPENKALVEAARDALDVFVDAGRKYLCLLPRETEVLIRLKDALAKENK